MKKYYILCVASIAAVAFSAVAASSASALNRFLANGAEITKETLVKVQGELLFEDAASGVAMTCSMNWDGSILPGGKNGPISELLTLAGEGIENTVVCTHERSCESEALIKALELTWLLVADFSDPENKPTKEPTLKMSCKILGVKVEDTCAGGIGGKGFNEPGGLLVEMSETEPLTKLNCTLGGAGSGLVVGNVLITANSGEVISGSP